MTERLLQALARGQADYDWATIVVEADGHRAEYRVLKDAIKVDGVRESCTYPGLVKAGGIIGAVPMTAYLIDQRFKQADVQNLPCPKWYPRGRDMLSIEALRAHSERVDKSIRGVVGTVGNPGKTWTYREDGQAYNYAWHLWKQDATFKDGRWWWAGIPLHFAVCDDPDLFVIQNEAGAHARETKTYEDYCQTCFGLVADLCIVDDKRRDTLGVYGDPGINAVAYGRSYRADPVPSFGSMGYIEKARTFGHIAYELKPTARDPEAVRITNGWAGRNLLNIDIPQLAGITPHTSILFHKLAAEQMLDLWSAWEQAGLLHYVKSWQGAWCARGMRRSDPEALIILSNHCYGTAFDINYVWNRLGREPADWEDEGTVKPLLDLAYTHGFYWGGLFRPRCDGMHFEVGRVKT